MLKLGDKARHNIDAKPGPPSFGSRRAILEQRSVDAPRRHVKTNVGSVEENNRAIRHASK